MFGLKTTVKTVIFLDAFASATIYFLLLFRFAQDSSPWGMTAVALVSMLTGAVCAAPLGAWVDRSNLRTLWIGSTSTSAFLTLGLHLTSTPWIWLVLLACITAAEVVSGTVIFKALPKIPGMTQTSASSFLVGMGAVLGVVTPAGAALLYAVAPHACFLLAFALQVPAVLLLLKVAPKGEAPQLEKLSFKDAVLGLGALSKSLGLLAYLPVMYLVVIATSAEDLSGLIYLQQVGGNFIDGSFPGMVENPGPAGYAALTAFWSLGLLLGSAIPNRRWFSLSTYQTLIVGGLVISLAILAEGMFPYAPVIAVAFLMGGIGNAVHNVGVRSSVYEQVPEEHTGQVWAMVSVSFTLLAGLGKMLGTPYLLGEPQQVVIGCGAIATGAILLFLVLRPNRKRSR